MSDDLVKRLRNLDTHPEGAPRKAADRIEELEAKLAKAVEALNSMAILPSHGYIKYFCRKTLAEIEGERE
jgi:HD superfamily phosphodiesterase